MAERVSEYLIKYLLAERQDISVTVVPENEEERFRLYRSLVNIRPAAEADKEYVKAEEKYLKALTAKKGITDKRDLTPVEKNIYLWKGDITTLRCDAIVNAANSAMTGCWRPCHSCIDNCIHTFAGIGLRYECQQIMNRQGHEEPTGKAKITGAYNLPCKYVIHTVGPVVNGRLTEEHCRLLESSYTSCLELALEKGIKNMAFCCISTGVFGFPADKAAEIAVRTVRRFIKSNDTEVIFNVFTQKDYSIYSRLLR
ncbi:protein-ADP-ribose hydrolase [Ruminococcus sp. Marseille-P6503]|uniref:protein-ADP-ribose hydrolase n=1 Tax=Ruminococcus sp. Marseille-P6503 TaxID=2364796 RepID=UPI000F51EA0A|nr:protein-ADP-ribose hydrolase [Ruminococcus sp. Marseille-P6503]